MKQCLGCLFYNKEKDELLQPDYMVEDEETPEFHICDVYESIPQDIISDKKQCEYFVDKNKV